MADASHVAPRGPLTGYRVLELGTTVAGPFCGRLFADFGAEVIKVEAAHGDAVRTVGRHAAGKSLYAASIFRGKLNVSLDLRTPEGQDLVRRMVPECDVVVENFRPGTMEGWGLGYNDLAAINPGLVMVRISGYGQTGPYSQRPGYGITTEAMSGLRELTGDPDRPPPRINIALTDYIAGTYAAFGTVMALLERQRSGRGQVVDIALVEGAFSYMECHIPAYAELGAVARRSGSRVSGNAPNNLYTTSDGRHIHMAAANDAVFKRLAALMERPDLPGDPRFAEGIKRAQNEDAIDVIVGAWIGARSLDEVEAAFTEAGVPAARVYTVEDIFADPHFGARDMLLEVPDDDLGSVTVTGVVPKLSATPGGVRWAGRAKGADTRRVLAELAGLSAADIGRLEADGIVQAHDPDGRPAAATPLTRRARPTRRRKDRPWH